jgi:hypothetical protein
VVWKNGLFGMGIKTHIGCNQEVYDAERSPRHAKALETAARRLAISERVTVFTDARAAVSRAASE